MRRFLDLEAEEEAGGDADDDGNDDDIEDLIDDTEIHTSARTRSSHIQDLPPSSQSSNVGAGLFDTIVHRYENRSDKSSSSVDISPASSSLNFPLHLPLVNPGAENDADALVDAANAIRAHFHREEEEWSWYRVRCRVIFLMLYLFASAKFN